MKKNVDTNIRGIYYLTIGGLKIDYIWGMGILYFISGGIIGVLIGAAIQRCFVKKDDPTDDSKKIQAIIDKVDIIIEDIKKTI